MMASLDDNIAALNAEIEEYRDYLRKAETSEERKEIFGLIMECRKTLNNLLQQREQG